MDITAIPKVELHSHLDGLITPEMAQLIRAADPMFPIRPDDFAGLYPVNNRDSFFRWWQVIDPIEGNLAYFYPITAHYMAQLKAANVHYAELMLALGELPVDLGAAVDKMRAYREWVNQQEAGQIQVEFLLCLGRQRPLETWPDIEAKALALFAAGLIAGVALAGPEAGHPVKPLQPSFARFQAVGLPIEIHAGEWLGPESVWDALEYGYPDRIGHGVSLFDDPKLIEIFQERQIHIEMCLTSNVKTGSVARFEDHPIQKAKELGLNFSINTDDHGPFLCTMNSEFALAATTFGFDERDFARIYADSLAARFQPTLRIHGCDRGAR